MSKSSLKKSTSQDIIINFGKASENIKGEKVHIEIYRYNKKNTKLNDLPKTQEEIIKNWKLLTSNDIDISENYIFSKNDSDYRMKSYFYAIMLKVNGEYILINNENMFVYYYGIEEKIN